MLHISLYGIHQLGNEVKPLLQLDINVRKGILAVVPEFHEPVLQADHQENQYDQED